MDAHQSPLTHSVTLPRTVVNPPLLSTQSETLPHTHAEPSLTFRCPNCGCDLGENPPVVPRLYVPPSLVLDRETKQIRSPPFVDGDGDGGWVPDQFSGEKWDASVVDGGWVPDTEDPFDLGLDFPATPRFSLPLPEMGNGVEGGAGLVRGIGDIWDELREVPDSEEENDDESYPYPSVFHKNRHSRPLRTLVRSISFCIVM